MSLAIMQLSFEPCKGLGDFACSMSFPSFLFASTVRVESQSETTFVHGSPVVGHDGEPTL